MICESCRNRNHEGCSGGTWCDCQHQGTGIPVLTVELRHEIAVGPRPMPAPVEEPEPDHVITIRPYVDGEPRHDRHDA